jgi:hypothetical protein
MGDGVSSGVELRVQRCIRWWVCWGGERQDVSCVWGGEAYAGRPAHQLAQTGGAL